MIKPSAFYTIILIVLGLTSIIAAVWVIVNLEPSTASNLYAFYGSIGATILFVSALTMFSLRQKFGIREMVTSHFWISLRQGFWVAVMVVVALILQSNNLFSWLNTFYLILALTFLETYFLYNERQKQRDGS